MRTYLGLVVIAFAAIGCTDEPEVDTGETAQAATIKCPDPDDCARSNGGGVYTEEYGDAHIGPYDFMLTRFINHPATLTEVSYVSFEGRGWDPGTTTYTIHPGAIDAAYEGNEASRFAVASIAESLTVPTVTLRRSNGTTFPVTGFALQNLRLAVTVDGQVFTLSFTHPDNKPANNNTTTTADVQTFEMMWNPGITAVPANQHRYCVRAPDPNNPGVPLETDPVVFQQGINVDPKTAVTVKDSNSVTLSCFHGAMAKVHWWGYPYRGSADDLVMFEAAMHMKRASYCGDASFYTQRNTDIVIADTVGVYNNSLHPKVFEASWGLVPGYGIRAICVNLRHRRLRDALYPPWTIHGEMFRRTCADGYQIPLCDDGAFGRLADEFLP